MNPRGMSPGVGYAAPNDPRITSITLLRRHLPTQLTTKPPPVTQVPQPASTSSRLSSPYNPQQQQQQQQPRPQISWAPPDPILTHHPRLPVVVRTSPSTILIRGAGHLAASANKPDSTEQANLPQQQQLESPQSPPHQTDFNVNRQHEVVAVEKERLQSNLCPTPTTIASNTTATNKTTPTIATPTNSTSANNTYKNNIKINNNSSNGSSSSSTKISGGSSNNNNVSDVAANSSLHQSAQLLQQHQQLMQRQLPSPKKSQQQQALSQKPQQTPQTQHTQHMQQQHRLQKPTQQQQPKTKPSPQQQRPIQQAGTGTYASPNTNTSTIVTPSPITTNSNVTKKLIDSKTPTKLTTSPTKLTTVPTPTKTKPISANKYCEKLGLRPAKVKFRPKRRFLDPMSNQRGPVNPPQGDGLTDDEIFATTNSKTPLNTNPGKSSAKQHQQQLLSSGRADDMNNMVCTSKTQPETTKILSSPIKPPVQKSPVTIIKSSTQQPPEIPLAAKSQSESVEKKSTQHECTSSSRQTPSPGSAPPTPEFYELPCETPTPNHKSNMQKHAIPTPELIELPAQASSTPPNFNASFTKPQVTPISNQKSNYTTLGPQIWSPRNEQKTSVPFNWETYLKLFPAEVAPKEAFRQSLEPLTNRFQANMLLEAKDPRNSNAWCLARVIFLEGPRLRLRFEGGGASDDFYELIDSESIRPVNSDPSDILTPPIGFSRNHSSYSAFVEKKIFAPDAVIAPVECFVKPPRRPLENLFKEGMKLEAVDRKNVFLICPATVGQVNLDKREIKIVFDGWKGSFDYTCKYYSRDIFPINWCRDNYLNIAQPHEWAKMLDGKFDRQAKPITSSTSIRSNDRPVNSTPKQHSSKKATSSHSSSKQKSKSLLSKGSHHNQGPAGQKPESSSHFSASSKEQPKNDPNSPHLDKTKVYNGSEREEEDEKTEEIYSNSSPDIDLNLSDEIKFTCQRANSQEYYKTPKEQREASPIFDTTNASEIESPRVNIVSMSSSSTSNCIPTSNSSPSPDRPPSLDEYPMSTSGSSYLSPGGNFKAKRKRGPDHSPKKFKGVIVTDGSEDRMMVSAPISTAVLGSETQIHQALNPNPAAASHIGATATATAKEKTGIPNVGTSTSKAEPANASNSLPTSDSVKQWSVKDVLNYISSDVSLAKYSGVFESNEIDGTAFLLLTKEIMLNHMGLKLGPMMKLENMIQMLKRIYK